jgi:membrane protease YdiL (CAAX protease family)
MAGMSVKGNNAGGAWRFVAEPLQRVDRECRQHVASSPGMDWQTIAVLLTTAVTLTVQQYIFASFNLPWFERGLTAIGWYDTYARGLQAVGGMPGGPLAGLLFWAAGSVVTYVVLPVLVIRLTMRRRVREFGLSVRGIRDSSWIYVVMYLLMLPPLFYFSGTARFLQTYPFYKPLPGEPIWPALVTWEMFYWVQFVALEFFFRGFLVHGTRHRFGVYSIFVMTVPYCMIHFGKPMPETFAAIVAGVVLGFMSLKTRSIWLGAALHIAVAATMDVLALWQAGHWG